jgi:signal peptidase II
MRPFLIVLAVLVLDRFTKWLVIRNLALYDAFTVVPGLFRLTHLENPGAAFSLFADSASPYRTVLLIAVSVAALAVISFLLWMRRGVFTATTVSLALIMGGALGNLWDRLADGKVTDFLDFYLGPHHWPPFNLADSAIVTGALLLLLRALAKEKPAPAAGN